MVHQTQQGSIKDLRWVDNQAYIFILINAVKSQQQQIEQQQQLLQVLQKRIDQMEKKK